MGNYTYVFEVTTPDPIEDQGMISEVRYCIAQGAALAFGSEADDTRFTAKYCGLKSAPADRPVVNTMIGNSSNVVQAGHVHGNIIRGDN